MRIVNWEDLLYSIRKKTRYFFKRSHTHGYFLFRICHIRRSHTRVKIYKINDHCSSVFFFSFVKVALTKNPKKRPTGERMLYQPFILAGDLNVRLSLELLNKVRNPEAAMSSQTSTSVYSGVASASAIDDDEGLAQNVPMRIASRTSRNKEKTTSEINSK